MRMGTFFLKVTTHNCGRRKCYHCCSFFTFSSLRTTDKFVNSRIMFSLFFPEWGEGGSYFISIRAKCVLVQSRDNDYLKVNYGFVNLCQKIISGEYNLFVKHTFGCRIICCHLLIYFFIVNINFFNGYLRHSHALMTFLLKRLMSNWTERSTILGVISNWPRAPHSSNFELTRRLLPRLYSNLSNRLVV